MACWHQRSQSAVLSVPAYHVRSVRGRPSLRVRGRLLPWLDVQLLCRTVHRSQRLQRDNCQMPRRKLCRLHARRRVQHVLWGRLCGSCRRLVCMRSKMRPPRPKQPVRDSGTPHLSAGRWLVLRSGPALHLGGRIQRGNDERDDRGVARGRGSFGPARAP